MVLSVRKEAEALPPGLRPFLCVPGGRLCYPLVYDSPVTPLSSCLLAWLLWGLELGSLQIPQTFLEAAPVSQCPLPCRDLIWQKIFLDLPFWIHSAYFSAHCRDWKPNSIPLRRKICFFYWLQLLLTTRFLSMATLLITMENKGRKERDTDAAVLPRGTCSSVKDVRQRGR